jgi:hypothetical protein
MVSRGVRGFPASTHPKTQSIDPVSRLPLCGRGNSRKEPTMNRLLWIASVAFILAGSTGCLHHNLRGGCASGKCSTGSCSSCSSCSSGKHGGGLLGKLGGGSCKTCGVHAGRTGCAPGPIGWQQGGMNYSSHLAPGCLAPGHNAAQQLQSQPFNAGPPTGTVAYPYYTHRGPRDFLLDNPPSIGR